MINDHLVLAFLWIAYCSLHSLMAATGFKNWIHQKLGRNYKYYRLFYVVFSFVTLAALVYYQLSIPPYLLFQSSILITITGWVIVITGLLVMAVCIYKYFMNLSGLRSLLYDNVSNRLMITGIHRYVRHPLYLGTFIFIWGLLLLIPQLSVLVSTTIITIYTLVGIVLEERKLVAEFGEQYKNYMRKVPKLWPLKGFKKGME